MNQRYFNRVSIKLVLVITGALFITLLIYTLVVASRTREQITNSYSQNAYAMSDIIKKSARHSMLLNRTEDVNEIIKTVGGEQNVKKIRIYNKLGKISYSTDSTEIGNAVSLSSEECRACHFENKMTMETPQDKMIRMYRNERNEVVLGLINPIRNENDCSATGCHPSDKKLLGVLDVVLSTEKIDEQVASNIRTIALGSVFIMILIALSAGTAIAIIVNRPMKRIYRGMKEIADGNLNYQIDVHTKDDLGAMAERFNEMSVRLDAAYGEIKQWNATLNKKVEDKNEELKKIYEQIVQVEKLASLGKLSATVAHELNNPLEGILTYSKLIAKMLAKENQGEKYEKILKYLNLIADESARCGRIVKDLVVFSRSSDTQFVPNDFRDIVEKDILLIKHHLEMHHVVLSKFMDKGPIPVFCDSQKIEQALLSVLINAIESMQDGCKLTVVATKIEGNGVVLIQDQGSGIAPDVLPHIFDPFFSTKMDKKGTGLGLSVAYGIITQHKGTIEVSETSEQGTVFKIQLPLYTQEAASA